MKGLRFDLKVELELAICITFRSVSVNCCAFVYALPAAVSDLK